MKYVESVSRETYTYYLALNIGMRQAVKIALVGEYLARVFFILKKYLFSLDRILLYVLYLL